MTPCRVSVRKQGTSFTCEIIGTSPEQLPLYFAEYAADETGDGVRELDRYVRRHPDLDIQELKIEVGESGEWNDCIALQMSVCRRRKG